VTDHQLKIWPEFFAKLADGTKTFEVRRNDRGFKMGDVLWLHEWSEAEGYTGMIERRVVVYLVDLSRLGCPGFVAMEVRK